MTGAAGAVALYEWLLLLALSIMMKKKLLLKKKTYPV